MKECFACCKELLSSPEPELLLLEDDSSQVLKLSSLCKIFNISNTLLLDLQKDSELETQVCQDCSVVVQNGERICQELEQLERQLGIIQDDLKAIIAVNFAKGKGEENVEFLVKKSFLECWEGWNVPVNKIPDTQLDKQIITPIVAEDSIPLTIDPAVVINVPFDLRLQSQQDTTEETPVVKAKYSKRTQSLKVDHPYHTAERIRKRRQRKVKSLSSVEAVKDQQLTDATVVVLIADDNNSVGIESNELLLKSDEDIENNSVTINVVTVNETLSDLETFKCTECNKRFKDLQGREIHLKRVHGGDMKPYECLVCKWKFASPSKLQSHAQSRRHSQIPEESVSSEAFVDCPECSQQFKNLSSLEAHVMGKHEGIDRPYQCDQCSKTYKKRNHLTDHKRISHEGDERPFQCEWCKEDSTASFSSQKKLDLHILTKHQHNTCSICSKNFKTPYILSRHMLGHTNIEDPGLTFICEICGAKYKALKRLKVHQLRHENKEPFSCEQCGRVFSEPRTLQHHRDSVHENKFKYHCEICGIGCQQIYMLNRHMMCHSSDKNFSCSSCPLKFKRKQQLVIHERKHTGERPFKCRLCGKEFTEKKKLKNHEFVHGGEKPYQCGICSKTFALRHYLTHHINSYHKNPKKKSGGHRHHVDETDETHEQELQLQDHDIDLEGNLILEQLDPKFVNVELIDESHVVHEEVIAYDESGTQFEGGLVVGEWIQFGFVSNE